MKYNKLSDVSFFPKEKISVSELTVGNYISTENMLPNKEGIVTASKLPTGQMTSRYKKNDILISNIRPYFKKIWFAQSEGGCSNDVLVIRAKNNINSKFLYYTLSTDDFFNYDTANSKGTKMPRGDKQAIMEYKVIDSPLNKQQKIVDILSAIDEKISLNKKINHHLVA